MNSKNIKCHLLVNISVQDYSLTDCKLTAWCQRYVINCDVSKVTISNYTLNHNLQITSHENILQIYSQSMNEK